jgi:hypothetical protein
MLEQIFGKIFEDHRKFINTHCEKKCIVAIGWEMTQDLWITFDTLNSLLEFSKHYKGGLKKEITKAYQFISKNRGSEVPVDGQKKCVEHLLATLSEANIRVTKSLGGNCGLNASALQAMGSQVIYIGNFFPDIVDDLPPETTYYLRRINVDYARKERKYWPRSLIIQAQGTNRYIICDGEGRRISELLEYMEGVETILSNISKKYELDLVALVGWHVLFSISCQPEILAKIGGILTNLSNGHVPLFGDMGSLDTFTPMERELLYSHIYSKFNYLSMNEDEFKAIVQFHGKVDDEITGLIKLMEKSSSLKIIWLHTAEYHIAITSNQAFIKIAQHALVHGAIAGAIRVETGHFPKLNTILERLKKVRFSAEGLKKIESLIKKYGTIQNFLETPVLEVTHNSKKYYIIFVPAVSIEKFVTTVGAGDIASGAFIRIMAMKSKLSA